MQLNPPPWPLLLDTSVTTVVVRPSISNISITEVFATQPEAERLAMMNAIPKRQVEFALGRHCLRQALQTLGYDKVTIPVGSDRQPILPSGALGSISHCEDYVVAACACEGSLIGLGIDVEKHQPLSKGILHLVLTKQEMRHIEQLYAQPISSASARDASDCSSQACHWEAIFFSIKESFYKALSSVHPFYVDFLQAEVHILDNCTFQITPLIQLLKLGKKNHVGYFAWDKDYLYSGISIQSI